MSEEVNKEETETKQDVVDNSELDRVRAELAASNAKVNEFRTTNISLTKQIADKGIKVDENFNIDIETAINEAVNPIKLNNDNLIRENASLKATLEEVVLSDKVKDTAILNGVHEQALSDVVSRAKNVFTVKDGKTIPKDLKSSRDAEGNILTPETWLKGLNESAPHLFKGSTGSGAQRSNGTATQPMNALDKISAGWKAKNT